MADEFDLYLAAALAPAERSPDRRFAERVAARIALEERLGAERRSVARELTAEVVAIAAVAAGLLWLGRAAPVAGFFAESPAAALTCLLTGFGLLVVLFSVQTSGGKSLPSRVAGNFK